MRQLLHKDRHWFIAPCGFASLAAIVAAGAHVYVRRDFPWHENWLESIEFVLIEYLLLATAAIFGWVAIGVARGPGHTAPTRVVSEDWGALFAISLGAAFFDMVSIRLTLVLRDGLAESQIGAGLMLLVAGSLGAIMTYGLVVTGWDLLGRRPARVILPDTPILAGTRFGAALEIPIPAVGAPAVRTTLSLIRSESGPISTDIGANERTLWSQTVLLEQWQDCGDRSRGKVERRFAWLQNFRRLNTRWEWRG